MSTLRSKRAKAFAFIFFNFDDKDLRKILMDQGAFAQLDRLSRNTLSVFYLHSANKDRIAYFNSHFLSKLAWISTEKDSPNTGSQAERPSAWVSGPVLAHFSP